MLNNSFSKGTSSHQQQSQLCGNADTNLLLYDIIWRKHARVHCKCIVIVMGGLQLEMLSRQGSPRHWRDRGNPPGTSWHMGGLILEPHSMRGKGRAGPRLRKLLFWMEFAALGGETAPLHTVHPMLSVAQHLPLGKIESNSATSR